MNNKDKKLDTSDNCESAIQLDKKGTTKHFWANKPRDMSIDKETLKLNEIVSSGVYPSGGGGGRGNGHILCPFRNCYGIQTNDLFF